MEGKSTKAVVGVGWKTEAGWVVRRRAEVRSSVDQFCGRLLRWRVMEETGSWVGEGAADGPGDALAMTSGQYKQKSLPALHPDG